MSEDRSYDLGSGVNVKMKGKQNDIQRSVDIEDIEEQGYTSELDREKVREHRDQTKDDRFEMAEDMTVKPTNPHRRFDAVRDIDVDGLGKKKTGSFDINEYKNK